MYYKTPPYLSRIFNVLLTGGLVLLLSCQSDPIVLNPPGGYEYLKQSFPLNTETSYSFQGDAHTGHSPRLYSGILTSGDTVSALVSALIRLVPQVLDSHEVCNADNISKVNIVLNSITQLAEEDTNLLVRKDAIEINLISLSEIWDEDAVLDSTKIAVIREAMDASTLLPDSLIEIKNQNIDIQLFDFDGDILSHFCETQEELGIVISYIPIEDESLKYIEFFSSDRSEADLGPRLSLEYVVEEETSINYNHYSLNNADWTDGLLDENVNDPYYVEKTLSDNWDMIYIYAFNLKENSPSPSPEMLSYDSLLFQDDIIANENLNTAISLLKINVTLNSDIEGIDSIIFSLGDKTFAYKSDIDPAGDNWNVDTNPDSTENNLAYDEGEVFNDYGIDNCPDSLEIGDNLCGSSISIYNPTGTEDNGKLDLKDLDNDGIWDEDAGEKWWDWGPDWCPDSLESGGFCEADSSACNCLESPNNDLDYDPNEDNADPAGDDWHALNNPEGTEGNHKWDTGEPFYDWGLDGLPMSLVGDPDESEGNGSLDWTDKNNNGEWDSGEGERWFDTGIDGKVNEDEVENYENYTEGNFIFNAGERYLDCGEGIDQIIEDSMECVVDSGDDYNIDPNDDNWNSVDSTRTQGNGIHNWTDKNDNGKWDENEGEEWFDWGLDGIQDTLEAFQDSSAITPALYENNYIFKLSEGGLLTTPELLTDTVSLWISEIQKINNNLLTIEVSVHSNVLLKGLQFQLYHLPFTKDETTLVTHTFSNSKIGEDKLFEDFTLYAKKNYSEEEFEGKLIIDFTNDVKLYLDFDDLNLFLANQEYIFSHENSNLILYVDTTFSDIRDNIFIYISDPNNSKENKYFISSTPDSIIFPIGYILKEYQAGIIEAYNGLILKTDGDFYNYSILSIQDNARIDIMYTK